MKIAILVSLIITGLSLLGFAQTKTFSPPVQNTPATKDPAFDKVIDVKDLPRVLLIGDSISIGYTVPVRKILATKANIHRIPDNGGPTTNGLANLHTWLGDGHWDVIHFN